MGPEYKKFLREFMEALAAQDSYEELESFLEGILTPKELIEIPKRLQIVKKLKNGESQHKIASELGLGVATVTRGSMEIKKGRFKNIK